MLKHLRWIRNRIAHDTDGDQISSISDIQDVREFYERILSGQDSIALLEKSKVVASHRGEREQVINEQENKQHEYRPASQRGFTSGCLGITAVIAVAAVIFLSFLTQI